jgi:GxxExxY protein
VYNVLGYGFVESVYSNALAKELRKAGLQFAREVPIDVWYEGTIVGQFRADFLVEEKVVLENKASQQLTEADRKQLLNCLRGTDIEVGLLLHFGSKPSHQRLIYSNDQKRR